MQLAPARMCLPRAPETRSGRHADLSRAWLTSLLRTAARAARPGLMGGHLFGGRHRLGFDPLELAADLSPGLPEIKGLLHPHPKMGEHQASTILGQLNCMASKRDTALVILSSRLAPCFEKLVLAEPPKVREIIDWNSVRDHCSPFLRE